MFYSFPGRHRAFENIKLVYLKMLVVAMGLLLLRVLFALATPGIRWSRVLSVDHLVALIRVHLVTKVCRKKTLKLNGYLKEDSIMK